MGVAEALVLLFVGLFAGILSTVFDVLAIGAASFLSHVTLWVLLNALVAVHVESRFKAIWWAIPFNLGYIESYFITTAATYEGFPKSLVVPLAGVALISPLLTYALWTAKNEKNLYGRTLSALVVAGALGSSYAINGSVGIYDVVVCVLLALVLLVVPTRKLKITRVRRKVEEGVAAVAAAAQGPQAVTAGGPQAAHVPRHAAAGESKAGQRAAASAPAADKPARGKRPSRRKGKARAAERTSDTVREQTTAEGASASRKAPRPTRRRGSGQARKATTTARRRRAAAEQEAQDRAAHREAAAQRRNRQPASDEVRREPEYDGYVSTLGTARSVRPSTRSRRSR